MGNKTEWAEGKTCMGETRKRTEDSVEGMRILMHKFSLRGLMLQSSLMKYMTCICMISADCTDSLTSHIYIYIRTRS